MNSVLRNVFLSMWILRGAIGSEVPGDSGHTSLASRTTAGPATNTFSPSYGSVVRATDSTGLCPSRTVNYITHTLARQCLRTDRVPSYNGTLNTASNVTIPITNSEWAVATTTVPAELPTTTGQIGAPASTTITGRITGHDYTIVQTAPTSPTAQSDADRAATLTSEEDAESLLDNANFLSFEEWKRQNLAKAGQLPEDVGNAQQADPHRPRPINNALESMGEEQEIDLDFTGFGGAPSAPPPEPSGIKPEHDLTQTSSLPSLRSKDAGKTCKERTNYASFDCAATVLKTNKECTHSSSILVEHKDSYMLNICSAKNKFFIVELCDDIQIDTIVLANYEFFSSNFRHFKASVSDRYPVKEEKWKVLGVFEARNTREMQAFLVENPLIWAKYLRIEMLSHYGTEYYCPISLLRVHGTTMMEDYRHQEELARGELEETEVVTLDAEVVATPPVAQEPEESTNESLEATVQAIPPVDTALPLAASSESPTQSAGNMNAATNAATSCDSRASVTEALLVYRNGSISMQVGGYESANPDMTCDTAAEYGSHTAQATTTASSSQRTRGDTTSIFGSSSPISAISKVLSLSSSTDTAQTGTAVGARSPAAQVGRNHTTDMPSTDASNATASLHPTVNPTTSQTVSNQTAAATNSTRITTSVASAPPPQPSTQESFFKSVTKRLLQLENNSTLSLQYIEEQSRILRDAFSKVSQRQAGTTNRFLSQLNDTVMTELHGFRQAYDQLWQSTVIELENQRESYQREMLAMSTRLTMVADELVWQKRMGIVQSTLLLLCLALVIFGRPALDAPLMQHMMNKSRDALLYRGGWESQSPPISPTSPQSRSPVSLFRRRIWRSRTEPTPEQRTNFAAASDSDLSRQPTRDEENSGGMLTPSSSRDRRVEDRIEPPSRPQRQSNWEDERSATSSPEFEKKVGNGSGHGGQPPSSPGRKRKKPKKAPPGGMSPSTSGDFNRPKSPLGSNMS